MDEFEEKYATGDGTVRFRGFSDDFPERGVLLHLRGGKQVMITSEEPAALRDAVLSLGKASPRARVELDEEEELEVEDTREDAKTKRA